MGTYGSTCTNSSSGNTHNGMTLIPSEVYLNAASVRMSSCCVYISAGSGTCKVKLFKKTGVNDFTLVAETGSLNYTTGQNTFSVDLSGDNGSAIDWIVGVYFSDLPGSNIWWRSSGSYHRYTGDATGTTTFTAVTGAVSISCQMVELIADAYVNSSTGNDNNAATSCSNPVLTFGKAYELLRPLGTIHVCNSGARILAERLSCLQRAFR